MRIVGVPGRRVGFAFPLLVWIQVVRLSFMGGSVPSVEAA